MARILLLAALLLSSSILIAQTTGGVYVNGNSTTNNVWAYARAADGTLTLAGTFPTQGSGAGQTHLDSQGSVALSQDGKFLFAVNAISNDITSFAVQSGATLQFIGRFPSGGTFPTASPCSAIFFT